MGVALVKNEENTLDSNLDFSKADHYLEYLKWYALKYGTLFIGGSL